MFGLLVGVLTLALLGHTLPAAQAAGPLPVWALLLALAAAYAACLAVWGGLNAVLGLRYKDE